MSTDYDNLDDATKRRMAFAFDFINVTEAAYNEAGRLVAEADFGSDDLDPDEIVGGIKEIYGRHLDDWFTRTVITTAAQMMVAHNLAGTLEEAVGMLNDARAKAGLPIPDNG